MKISSTEEMLEELRQAVPKLGELIDSYIDISLHFAYFSHSNRYEETCDLWIGEEGIYIPGISMEDVIKHIKTRIICIEQEKEELNA